MHELLYMPKCLPDHSLSLSAGVHWPFEKQRIFYARKFESDFAPLSVGTIAIRLKKRMPEHNALIA